MRDFYKEKAGFCTRFLDVGLYQGSPCIGPYPEPAVEEEDLQEMGSTMV